MEVGYSLLAVIVRRSLVLSVNVPNSDISNRCTSPSISTNCFSRFATSGGQAINVDVLGDSDRLVPDRT